MPDTLLFILVVVPFIAALGLYALRNDSLRMVMVLATAVLLTGSSLALFSHETVAFSSTLLGINPQPLIVLLDFVVLFIILAVGLSSKHRLIIYLAGAQIVLLAIFKLVSPAEATGQALFLVDPWPS
jgi:ech hydrogenase subunit A